MKWYQDCRLELDRFLDVLFDRDYSRLVIAGEPPEQVLKEAWRKIYLQYSELMQEGTYNELFEKTKRLQELNARIALLDGIVQHLQLSYDERLVGIVNEMAVPLALTVGEDPAPKLKPIQGRIKRMLLDAQKLEREIEGLIKEETNEVKMEQFDDWLGIMSKQYGYAVRAKDISVTQFVRNQKRLNKMFEKKQNDGGNRKD